MSNQYLLHYYLEQARGGGQRGGGFSPFEVYQGHRFQTGYGIFGNILRFVLPFVKSLDIGKTALSTGTNVLGDVLAGENLKESLKKRGKTAATDIAKRAFDNLTTHLGKGATRQGLKRSRNFHPLVLNKKQKLFTAARIRVPRKKTGKKKKKQQKRVKFPGLI
jgi:hypothetical protein